MSFNHRFLAGFLSATLALSAYAQNTAEPLWSLLTDATTSDHVTDLWVNPQGASYQLGHISNIASSTALDGLMLVKTGPNGQELWRRYYHPQSNDYQFFAGGVAGDAQGNVYLVYTDDFRYTDLNNTRIAVKKIDPDGNELWNHYYTDVLQNLVESPVARSVIFKNGIIYFVAGTAGTDPSDDMDAMIVKVDGATGNLIQKIVFNSQYDTDDFFRRVEVSDNGDMWAVGRSRGYMYPGNIYSDYDANVVKYNAAGEFQWEHRENGTGNSLDFGINHTIDGQGNCYTSNQLRMIGINQRRIQIQKIAPDGMVLWTHFYQGSSSGYNHDQPVKMLPNGNVVFSASNEEGIVTRALNGQSGEVLWTQFYNRSAAGASNRPYDMAVDASGNICVIGESRDNTPFGAGWDIVALKYSGSGELIWVSNYNRGNYDSMGEYGVALQFDDAQNLYVAGTSQVNESQNYNSDFVLLKFGNGTLGLSSHHAARFACYPNPVRDILTVQAQEPITAVVLMDIFGQTVRSWNHSGAAEATVSLNLEGLAAGVYFLQTESRYSAAVTKILKN